MKKIFYTQHLKIRLEMRKIPYDFPKIIYQTSKEHYFDRATYKRVAVKKIKYKNKLREMAVIYNETENQINIITIHPLKTYQKISRVNSGRWTKL